MEMIDIRAAIQVCDDYTQRLNAMRTMVSQTLGETYSDPEIAEGITSLQDSLKRLWRNSLYALIALNELLPKQVHLVINYPAELAELISAQTRYGSESTETHELFKKLEKVGPVDQRSDKVKALQAAKKKLRAQGLLRE